MDGARRPRLATTYEGGDPALLGRVLPLVDCLEVSPDVLAQRHGEGMRLEPQALAELTELSAEVDILVHGVGLSIQSWEGMNEDYLRLLDGLLEQMEVTWHSEHLGYTLVGGEFLGTMLSLPETDQVLDLVAGRVESVLQRYPIPFLLENVAQLLPPVFDQEPEGLGRSRAQFLNRLAERTGCGLLLDLYNLECDAHNHGLDVAAFLDTLDLERVREVHVACGVEHHGMRLDVHSRPLLESTVSLARQVCARCAEAPMVTYEVMPEARAALGVETIAEQLVRLRETLLP